MEPKKEQCCIRVSVLDCLICIEDISGAVLSRPCPLLNSLRLENIPRQSVEPPGEYPRTSDTRYRPFVMPKQVL